MAQFLLSKPDFFYLKLIYLMHFESVDMNIKIAFTKPNKLKTKTRKVWILSYLF